MNSASSESAGSSADGTRHQNTSQEDNPGRQNKPGTSGTSDGASGGDDSQTHEALFECNICLDTARDAVVSRCGHLFW